MLRVVGYPRGAIGPVGSRCPATVLLDEELAGEPALLCGAGDAGWVFEVGGAALARAASAVVFRIHV